VNTAIVGSTAVLNRVAEDGILTDFFRKIHKKYGTTSRMINFIVGIQLIVILISHGKVYVLGEAYAFGVLWSIVLQTLSTIILRFKYTQSRKFMTPLNLRYKNLSIPVGSSLIFLFFFSVAAVNLITKKVATISGIAFTVFLYTVFYISERLNAKRANLMFEEGHREELNATPVATLAQAVSGLTHEKRVVIGVKDPDNLYHLEEFLKNVNDENHDILVVYAKPSPDTMFGKISLTAPKDETEIFSNVILIAEKYGPPITPLIVESNDPYYAISQVAKAADADRIILGVSGTYGAQDQMERMVMAWGVVKDEKKLEHPVNVEILWEGREVNFKFTA